MPIPFQTAVLSSTRFSPALLFRGGEVGAWYDPSDLSTMYQDIGGVTPVTAVEQPVGLILDKSNGLAVGPELVTNGGFDADANWTKMANWTISGGVASTNNTIGSFNGISQNIITPGKWYKVTLTISGFVSGSCVVGMTTNYPITITANGTYTCYGQANGGIFYVYAWNGGVFNVDNVSVREIAGNHAFQGTSASRPVLSARVNLLTRTEEFDNAAWTKQTNGTTVPTVTADQGTAPTGTSNADRIDFAAVATTTNYSIISQTMALGTTTSYTGAVWLKAWSAGDIGKTIWAYMFDGTSVINVTSITLTASWQLLVNSGSVSGGAGRQWAFGNIGATYGGTNQAAVSVLAWGADFRPTNVGVNLPPYQRVVTGTAGTSTTPGTSDYDTVGFPLYLKFDGTDDSLATGTITPTTDKAQVFAGVRKLSDAAQGLVAELSATIASNAGAFALTAPNSAAANYNFSSKGTTQTDNTVTTYSAPIINVVTGLSDIAGASNLIRVNGSQVGSVLTTQGTGNFGSYPLYIGRRGGTTNPFNGNLYGLIVRFSTANMDEPTVGKTEAYMNSKTGAY